MSSEAQRRATHKYNSKRVCIAIRMSEEQRERIRQSADESGQHIKDYILEAIDERIERMKGDKTE